MVNQLTQPQLLLAYSNTSAFSGLAGVRGRHTIDLQVPITLIVTSLRANSMRGHQLPPHLCFSEQFVHCRLTTLFPIVVDRLECALSLFGSIWGAEDPIAAFQGLHDAYANDALEQFAQQDGDYAAVVQTPNEVILLAGAESAVPLFYVYRDRHIEWSSNFMDLVLDPISELDLTRLIHVATGNSVLPYSQIFRLNPGEVVRFTGTGPKSSSTNQNQGPKPSCRENNTGTVSEQADLLRTQVCEAVRKRVRRSRRVGILLSGGIDSAALAACLAELNVDVRAYHWSHPDCPPADESHYAQATADWLEIPITFVKSDRAPASDLVEPQSAIVLPHNHPYCTWWKAAVDRMAEDGVDCVVSGRFADVYLSKPTVSVFDAFDRQPGLVTAELFWNALSARAPIQSLFRPPQDAVHFRSTYHYQPEAQRILSATSFEEISLQAVSIDVEWMRPVGMVNVFPFHDREIRKLGLAAPASFKSLVYKGQYISKPILRYAFLDRLPPIVISRSTRPSVETLQINYVLRNRDLFRRILSNHSYLVQLGIVNGAAIDRVTRDRKSVSEVVSTLIVNALVEKWLSNVRNVIAKRA